MKKLFSLIICLMAFIGIIRSQDNVIDEVIWVIGDEAILRSEVEAFRLEMQFYNQRIPGDPYCYIPEQMAIQKLYLHQAKLDSVGVPDSQIFQMVEGEINKQINMVGSKEKLEEYRGRSINTIREEVRKNVQEGLLIQAVQQNIVKNMQVTPSEVRAFYNRIPKDSLPFIPTTVEVEIVTQEPVIELEEIDDIKRRLREYSELVTTGNREFSTLARLYSEDIASAQRGGELGFTGRATFVPEFAAAAFELNDPSKISRIVETEYGYHIIQLIEKRGDLVNVRHILLKPKVSEAELTATTAKMDSIRTEIIEGKFTFQDAATYISQDKNTRNNKGLMVNQGADSQNYSDRIGTSRFEMSELPPEIGKIVYNMNVGEISQPFTMINSSQKTVVAIVRLKSRTEGHRASLSDDYQSLKSMVEQEKQEKTLNDWLVNKIQNTYVRINDNWRNCDFQLKGWLSE